jgi:ribosomal protein L37AE/L43A
MKTGRELIAEAIVRGECPGCGEPCQDESDDNWRCFACGVVVAGGALQ